MVGVRVARRLGVALRSVVLVLEGNGLAVEDGLYARGVELGLGVRVCATGVAVGEAMRVISITEVCVGAGEGDSPAWTVRAIAVGI